MTRGDRSELPDWHDKHLVSETLREKLKDVSDQQKKALLRQMQEERNQGALGKLKDVPDLQKAAATDPRLTKMAENSPSELREHWKRYQEGRAKGTIKSPDFGDYVEIRGSESRGTAGEYGETFGRGADEIVAKSPKLTEEGKAATTAPGTDMITYNPKNDISKRPNEQTKLNYKLIVDHESNPLTAPQDS